MATEHPILFTAPMVRAILAGRKTQTRRVVARANCEPCEKCFWERLVLDDRQVPAGALRTFADNGYLHVSFRPHADDPQTPDYWVLNRLFPRWNVGDRLWVKETWTPRDDRSIYYRADGKLRQFDFSPPGLLERWEKMQPPVQDQWVPSIFMHRWASRLTLEITDIRVQRLQEISAEECLAEGMQTALKRQYKELWDTINGKKHPWDVNPWVWCVTFKEKGTVDARAHA